VSFGTAIVVNWIVTLGLLLVSTATALVLGWRGNFDLRTWRYIKLISTLLGAVGVVVFLSNFELTITKSTADESEHRRLLEFIETKSRILEKIALSCGDRQSEVCNLALSANGVTSYIDIRDGKDFQSVGPMPSDAGGQAFADDIRQRIRDMNESLAFTRDVRTVLSNSNREALLFVGQICIVLALAGSAGETAFQLRSS
jgi:hypothetical protein